MSKQSRSDKRKAKREASEGVFRKVTDKYTELSDTDYGDPVTSYRRWFEAYKSLTFWNKHDNDAVLGFDRIFIPVSVGLPALAKVLPLSSSNGSGTTTQIIATVASLLLLIFWALLSVRYRQNIDIRYRMMQEIERKLRFCAHRYYHDYYAALGDRLEYLKPSTWYWPRDRDLRIYFSIPVGVLLIFYLVLLSACPEIFEGQCQHGANLKPVQAP